MTTTNVNANKKINHNFNIFKIKILLLNSEKYMIKMYKNIIKISIFLIFLDYVFANLNFLKNNFQICFF